MNFSNFQIFLSKEFLEIGIIRSKNSVDSKNQFRIYYFYKNNIVN